MLERWALPPPQTADDPVVFAQFIARLAADGLWVYESLSSKPLSRKIRQQVAEHLAPRDRSDVGGGRFQARQAAQSEGRRALTDSRS